MEVTKKKQYGAIQKGVGRSLHNWITIGVCVYLESLGSSVLTYVMNSTTTNRICFMYECSPMWKLTMVGYRGSFYINFISCQQKILTQAMEEVLHQLVRNCSLSHYLQGYKVRYISGDVEFQPSIVPR